MKLKYEINTILKYNKVLGKTTPIYDIEAIILGNKCICIADSAKCFVFNRKYQLIQTIDLNDRYITKNNMISILNYPNLFALKEEFKVIIYEVKLKKKKGKVILKNRVNNPKKYQNNSYFYIFSLLCADILFFFQDCFFIYNIKNETFSKKKFIIPIEKKYESLQHYKRILKIIEYKENEVIILLRDIIYGKEDDAYNCEIKIKNLIILYDIFYGDLKKIFIEKEDSGECNTYLGSYFLNQDNYSNDQNIFLINNSIVYIKDHRRYLAKEIYYSIYIINILNGDIKYKFEDNYITSKCEEFFPHYIFQKSIYLCDNLFLFNGYELEIKKNKIKSNKIDIIHGTNADDYKNNNHYYIKLKKNLILLYNSQEIKICHFIKK